MIIDSRADCIANGIDCGRAWGRRNRSLFFLVSTAHSCTCGRQILISMTIPVPKRGHKTVGFSSKVVSLTTRLD
ncbi:MAG: hypothetical protein L6Q98_22530, partial [Anaerolineae bacterium]|nr:hypothetical protein [Anaerolineae bacterium]